MSKVILGLLGAGLATAVVIAGVGGSGSAPADTNSDASDAGITVDEAVPGLVECRKLLAGGAPQIPKPLCSDADGGTTISSGSQRCAEAYYATTFGSGGLGLLRGPKVTDSSLDDLLAFIGFPALRVGDLENKTASQLRLVDSEKILAVSIFAPKITNVSPGDGGVQEFGWRKLVRFIPTPESRAAAAGIDRAFVLLNYFQKDLRKSPFLNGSVNTQAILTSGAAAIDAGREMVYWLDYDKTSKGAPLSLFLPATFDGRFPVFDDSNEPTAIKKYFIPDGCVSCHGESVTRPLLNYFDTDHFEDRLEVGNDFSAVAAAGWHMFPDENADAGCTHHECFDAVRQLNREMAAENLTAEPCGIEFQAANNWLALHDGNDSHLVPTQRALHFTIGSDEQPVPAEHSWASEDKELLGLLNRYCFRCHGSVRFTVFDKEAVLARHAQILNKISGGKGRELMPTDRPIPDSDRQRMLELLIKLGSQ